MNVLVEERAPSRFVVSLEGDLDIATAGAFTDAVTRLLATTGVEQLIVDLAEVRFLDSSGVRALLQSRKAVEEAGGTLSVSNPREFVTEVLRMAAVDQLLGVPAAASSKRSR